ncbi:hypothetical protein PCANC_09745 [Puccinia coronata f. sp. avenae]|uniref:Uncharacterized protein n=1 Tax=Puccinia coronata f. sp. avenae TaxID=200324 RepID=A0A2N5VT76_9BASI|nr:hypothetical protein PCANC_09745 [Puccinia coronata f. sp. avenae]
MSTPENSDQPPPFPNVLPPNALENEQHSLAGVTPASSNFLEEILEANNMHKLLYLRFVELHEQRPPPGLSMANQLTWDPALMDTSDVRLNQVPSKPPMSSPHSNGYPLP